MKDPFGDYVLVQGNTHQEGSYRLINQRLVAALRADGQRVVMMSSDHRLTRLTRRQNPSQLPRLYIHHSWPFDLNSAPGRVNVFILNYEYARPRPVDGPLIERLNALFDLVVVPTQFVAGMLRQNGLTIPCTVVPWGVDPSEFHPGVSPLALPLRLADRFVFLFLGAANARKGFDLAVRAYCEEFTSRDNVLLMLKESYRFRHTQPWVEQVARRYQLDNRSRASAPVFWVNGYEASVAAYCRRADLGVFPYRGEGFGLGLLECLACGTPVVASNGTGPVDFCTAQNSQLIEARAVETPHHNWLEPELGEVRRRMREAYQAGPPSPARRQEVAASVAHWSWEATWQHMLETLGSARPVVRSRVAARLGYAYADKGPSGWRRLCSGYYAGLRRVDPDLLAVAAIEGIFPLARLNVLLAQSEYALESFLRCQGRRVLHLESTVLGERVTITNAERAACGLPPICKTAMELWRSRQECERAELILVPSEVSRQLFLKVGHGPQQVKVLDCGLPLRPRPPLRKNGPLLRFLFVATDPYRKGVRLLFEAWDRLRIPDAELVVRPSQDVLASRLLLKLLTRNPNIVLAPNLTHRQFLATYGEFDCQVLPSLEDSFSFAVGDGMTYGLPAIVSDQTGIHSFLEHGRDGWVVKAGCLDSLQEALWWAHEHRQRLPQMGQAAWETARKWPWRRFEKRLQAILEELGG